MKALIFGLLLCGAVSFDSRAEALSGATAPQGSPSAVTAQLPSPSVSVQGGTSVSAKGAPSLEKNSAVPKLKQPTDSVYSALVLATNVETPTQPVPELAAFGPRLKHVFGYNHLELIGSHTEMMDDPDEHWLVPSKLFSLSIKSKREKNAAYLLNLQLYQENKMLAGFDAKLCTQSPIFIRGPLYGKGQLVIVVIVK